MREHILKATGWLLPPAVFRLLSYYHPRALGFYLGHPAVLRANRQLHSRHPGERCFILCNGPSVNEQDIRPLRGETVFSVSNGYLHPDYRYISPRYHCVPQITYASLPPEKTVDWFREMDRSIGNAEMFLDCQEWSLVQRHRLFSGREAHFVCMGKNHFRANAGIPDLAGIIPRVQTVPIMALMIAMYMGFREIYLLGVDHDWFVKKEYRYFYGPGATATDSTLASDGRLLTNLWDELPAVGRVWAQYRAIKRIAQANGVRIYNATHGGMLDEFERVRLEDVLK
jgi:hypothetical protein